LGGLGGSGLDGRKVEEKGGGGIEGEDGRGLSGKEGGRCGEWG